MRIRIAHPATEQEHRFVEQVAVLFRFRKILEFVQKSRELFDLVKFNLNELFDVSADFAMMRK